MRYFAANTDLCSGYGGVLFARALMGEGFGPLYPEGKSTSEVYTFAGGLSAAALALGRRIEDSGADRVITGASVYRVTQTARGAEVSYMRNGQLTTVAARTVIVAAPKFIAKHIVSQLSTEQRAAMGRMVYSPYLVGAVGIDGVLSTQLTAANVIGGPLVSFINVSPVAKRQLFRIELPLLPEERGKVLSALHMTRLAGEVADFFEKMSPGARDKIDEIRLWRRGHNWYLPVQDMLTGFQELASRSFGRVHFANADSMGPISDFGWAMLAADAAVERALATIAPQNSSRNAY